MDDNTISPFMARDYRQPEDERSGGGIGALGLILTLFATVVVLYLSEADVLDERPRSRLVLLSELSGLQNASRVEDSGEATAKAKPPPRHLTSTQWNQAASDKLRSNR